MFFDPADYLEADPAEAASEREAERLRREAGQRAKLCETMTRLAAEGGFEGAKIYLVAREAKLGLGTYYKLFESREACLVEAFEKCGALFLRHIEEGLACTSAPSPTTRAALRRATETLAADPGVARLLLIEVRAGDEPCREAHQRWLAQLADLIAGHCDAGGPTTGDKWLARMVAGALVTLLAAELDPATGSRVPAGVLPDLTYALLAPYLEVEPAITAMRDS